MSVYLIPLMTTDGVWGYRIFQAEISTTTSCSSVLGGKLAKIVLFIYPRTLSKWYSLSNLGWCVIHLLLNKVLSVQSYLKLLQSTVLKQLKPLTSCSTKLLPLGRKQTSKLVCYFSFYQETELAKANQLVPSPSKKPQGACFYSNVLVASRA